VTRITRWIGLALGMLSRLFLGLLLDVPPCGKPLLFFKKKTLLLMLAISNVLKIPRCYFVRVGPMNLKVKPQRDYIGNGITTRPCEISCPEQVCFCVCVVHLMPLMLKRILKKLPP
jgi:hypothetical protein